MEEVPRIRCAHPSYKAQVDVLLVSADISDFEAYVAEISIMCSACSAPFEFIPVVMEKRQTMLKLPMRIKPALRSIEGKK
jgi:hypothetical protein